MELSTSKVNQRQQEEFKWIIGVIRILQVLGQFGFEVSILYRLYTWCKLIFVK